MIKIFTYTIKACVIVFMTLASFQNVKAQCSVDNSCSSLICPAKYDTARVGVAFNQSFTMNVPTDTAITTPISATGTIDSVVLNQIRDLPTSLSGSSNVKIIGGSSGCFEITGTPTYADAGVHYIDFIFDVYVDAVAGAIPLGKQKVDWIIPDVPLVIWCADSAYNDQAAITNCSTDDVQLNATVKYSGAGSWSTNGTGSFSPAATSLDAMYTPSNDDTSTTVTLTFTPTTNCQASFPGAAVLAFDTRPQAVIDISETTICDDVASIAVNGTVANQSTTSWTTSGDGTFGSGGLAVNSTYTVGTNDATNGTVDLTLTAQTLLGVCPNATDVQTITINNCAGLEDLAKQGISIAPNPASDVLSIAGSEGTYSLVSAAGEVVATGNVGDDIDVSGFASGVYSVVVVTSKGSSAAKVVIQ